MSEGIPVVPPSAGPSDDFARWRKMAVLAFLAQGFAGVSQKCVSALQGEYRLFFLCCTYVVATVLACALHRARHMQLTPAGMLLGSLAGISCVLSVYLLLAALKQVGGVVVFSVVPAAALALTLLAGRVLFNERLSRQQTIGVLLALAGIVIVQL